MSQYFGEVMSRLVSKEGTLDRALKPGAAGKLETKRTRKREAKHVSSLLRTWRNTAWNTHDNIFYIIPSKWFSKWKAYTGYDEPRSLSQTGTPNSVQEPDPPGPITYKELLADDKDYLHNYSVPDNARDKIIKDSAEEGKDYMTIPKELYEFLAEKYGGTGITRCQVDIGCNGIRKFYPKLVRVYHI